MATQQNVKFIQDVMTKNVQTVPQRSTLREVARLMKEHQIGDVVVTDDKGKLVGIVTDRDLVIRGLAEARDPEKVTVGEIASKDDLVTLAPDASVEEAIKLMSQRAVRRIPVVQGDKAVGIVSIGDLAQVRDPRSALGQISSAPPSA